MIDIGNLLVEEADERAHEPAFRLAFLAEKENVMAGKKGKVDFGKDRIFVAEDAGERSSPACSICKKLSRTSSFTDLEVQPLARRSLRLVGRTPADIKYSWWKNRIVEGGRRERDRGADLFIVGKAEVGRQTTLG